MAADLKSVEVQASRGSNPLSSAMSENKSIKFLSKSIKKLANKRAFIILTSNLILKNIRYNTTKKTHRKAHNYFLYFSVCILEE